MAIALNFDAIQQRVDDAEETMARPNVPPDPAGAADQWDEQTHGPFPFRRASASPEVHTTLRFGNSEQTTGALQRASRSNESAYSATEGVYPPSRVPGEHWTPIARVQRPAGPTSRFEVLQQWEGTVTSITGDEFSATLRDLTASQRPDEQAAFETSDVSDDDRDLLVPGAVFYWALGYETGRSGQVSRVSRLRLRRLPRWSKRDLSRLEEKARTLQDAIGASR